jgi:hypothetical protein
MATALSAGGGMFSLLPISDWVVNTCACFSACVGLTWGYFKEYGTPAIVAFKGTVSPD